MSNFLPQAVRGPGTLKSVVLDSEPGSDIKETSLRKGFQFLILPLNPVSPSQFLCFDSDAKTVKVKFTDCLNDLSVIR